MISSISCLSRPFIFFFLVAISAGGCAGGELSGGVTSVATKEKYRIAVFPIENLSGVLAPVKDLRSSLISKLNGRGLSTLGEKEMERCIEKHRVRDVGGLSGSTAEAFRGEANTDAILITSLERYDTTFPPKISLICRLVSTGAHPSILWTDRTGLSGIDSPGAFGLGIIEDPNVLVEKALLSLTDSLAGYLSASEMKGKVVDRSSFRPRV